MLLAAHDDFEMELDMDAPPDALSCAGDGTDRGMLSLLEALERGPDGRPQINAGLRVPAAGAGTVVPRLGTSLGGDKGARALAGSPCTDYAFCDTASPFVMLSFDSHPYF